jgi:hypothetical protein
MCVCVYLRVRRESVCSRSICSISERAMSVCACMYVFR